MKQTDMRQVGERLGDLAEYFDRKAPTPNALKVWGDALRDLDVADVLIVLSDWPKTRAAFPVASQVVEQVRTIESNRRKLLSSHAMAPAQAIIPRGDPNSPAYLRFKDWWAEFKRKPPSCEHKDSIGSFVRVGAIIRGRDEEWDEERRAIQSEGA